MNNEKQNFTLVIGEPGVGKSYELITRAILDKQIGRRVYIMTPTHASKKSLRSNIEKRANEAKTSGDYDLIMSLQSDVHVGENAYFNQQSVYIDEIGQTNTTVFNSMLLQLQGVPNANVYLFGDIRQLQPVKNFSPLESLLRENVVGGDFWKFVSDNCYEDFNYNVFTAPKAWRINSDIHVNLLRTNHRLNKLGYTAYDNKFYDNIIETVVEASDLEYAQILKKQLAKHSAILVATKKRGQHADELIKSVLEDEAREIFDEQNEVTDEAEFIEQYVDNRFKEVATFIKYKERVYLNPNNENYAELRKEIDGVPTIEESMNYLSDDEPEFEYHVWATVHAMQGITIKSVTFFMGNEKIGRSRKEHYSTNLLYTSITRASDEIVLLGLKDSFLKMRNQQPENPQNIFGHKRAIQAKNILFSQLQKTPVAYSWSEVFDLYMNIFNNFQMTIPEQEEIEAFDIKNLPYTERELHLQFKNYKEFGDKFFNYKKMFYEDYRYVVKSNASKGNHGLKGKGSVQQWVRALSDEGLEELHEDVDNLSVRKFKAKYDKTLVSVKKALASLED